jgi:hypothetical protein
MPGMPGQAPQDEQDLPRELHDPENVSEIPPGGYAHLTGFGEREPTEFNPLPAAAPNDYRILLTIEMDDSGLNAEYGLQAEIQFRDGQPEAVVISSNKHGGVHLHDDHVYAGAQQLLTNLMRMASGQSSRDSLYTSRYAAAYGPNNY